MQKIQVMEHKKCCLSSKLQIQVFGSGTQKQNLSATEVPKWKLAIARSNFYPRNALKCLCIPREYNSSKWYRKKAYCCYCSHSWSKQINKKGDLQSLLRFIFFSFTLSPWWWFIWIWFSPWGDFLFWFAWFCWTFGDSVYRKLVRKLFLSITVMFLVPLCSHRSESNA